MIQENEWEQFYEANAATEWYPSEPVVRMLCSYRKAAGARGVRVLDMGCGNGRHVWLAAKEGFTAYGVDLSREAVAMAKRWLDREGLPYGGLTSGDVAERLPYPDDFFDVVISYGVFDHMPIERARQARDEARRIMKPSGTIFMKLEAITSFTFDPARQFRKNEIMLEKEAERGIMQHYYDVEEVAEFTSVFRTVKCFRDDYRRFGNLDRNYQSRWIFIGTKA